MRSPICVEDLSPGDLVTQLIGRAVFVARTEHPIWPGLQLVIWRLEDGSWSHDALDAGQVVGTIEHGDDGRQDRLRRMLLGEFKGLEP